VIRDYNGKKTTCLVFRGLDLVDGTSVYDVKPFVLRDRIDSSVNGTGAPYLVAAMIIYTCK